MRFDLGLRALTMPSEVVFAVEVLELRMPDLLVACLDFTVEVREGAIFEGDWDWGVEVGSCLAVGGWRGA